MTGYLLNDQLANWVSENAKKVDFTPSAYSPSIDTSSLNQVPVLILNDDVEDMPPFGVGQIVGYTNNGDLTYIRVQKPTTTAYFAGFVVNTGLTIKSGKKGVGKINGIIEARYDGGWGGGSGSMVGIDGWTLATFPTGKPYIDVFVHGAGKNTGSDRTVFCQFIPITHAFIKAPAGGIAGRIGSLIGSATCDYLRFNGSSAPVDTTRDIQVYNWGTQVACKDGARYGVATRMNNHWVLVAEDCADEGSVVAPASILVNFPDQPNPVTDPLGPEGIILQGGQTTWTGDVDIVITIGGALVRGGGDIFRPDGVSKFVYPP